MTTATAQKKITRATLKSFIKNNHGKLYIMVKSHFDGMTDGTREVDRPEFTLAVHTDRTPEHTLGLAAAWFVGQSRDHFTPYEDDQYVGYEVWNCCVHFILVVEKK